MRNETVIFLPSPPRETIHTIHGRMMYSDWITREAERINAVPSRHCRVVRGKKNGRPAIWAVGNLHPDYQRGY